jgi:hypothetical protein
MFGRRHQKSKCFYTFSRKPIDQSTPRTRTCPHVALKSQVFSEASRRAANPPSERANPERPNTRPMMRRRALCEQSIHHSLNCGLQSYSSRRNCPSRWISLTFGFSSESSYRIPSARGPTSARLSPSWTLLRSPVPDHSIIERVSEY